MKKTGMILAAFCGMSVAVFGSTAEVANNWQSAGTPASWSGNFLDAAHWSKGGIPGDGTNAFFNMNVRSGTTPYTVDFGTEPVTNYAHRFRINTADGESITLKGSHWGLPSRSTDYYHGESFGFRGGTGNGEHYFNIENYNDCKSGRAELKDFEVRVWTEGKSYHTDFKKGTINLKNPFGKSWSPELLFGSGIAVAASGCSWEKTAEVSFWPGTVSYLPGIGMQCNAETNRLVFGGGVHFVGCLSFPNTSKNYLGKPINGDSYVQKDGDKVIYRHPYTEVLVTNNAVVIMDAPSIASTAEGACSERAVRIHVADGGNLCVKGANHGAGGGTFELSVGPKGLVQLTNGVFCVADGSCHATGHVSIVGGTLRVTGGANPGLKLGSDTVLNGNRATLWATNGTLEFLQGSVKVTQDSAVLVDSYVTNAASINIGTKVSEATWAMTGGRFDNAGNFYVGTANGVSGNLCLTNVVFNHLAGNFGLYDGNVVMKDVVLTNASTFYIGVDATHDPKFYFEGGELCPYGSNMYFGYADNPNTEVIVTNADVNYNATIRFRCGNALFANSRIKAIGGGSFIVGSENGHSVPAYVTVRGGTMEQPKPLQVAIQSAVTHGVFNLEGGELETSGSSYIGLAGHGVMNMTAGYWRNFRPAGAGYSFCYLGQDNGAYGELNISGGTFDNQDGEGTYIGYKGPGTLHVSGGEMSDYRIHMGQHVLADKAENLFKMTGGRVYLKYYSADYGLHACYHAAATGLVGRVKLDGGVLKCGRIYGGAGASVNGGCKGFAAFEADGGTIETPGTTTNLLCGFNTAELGANGLTIDSDYDATIQQTFSNKTGVAGMLVLKGSGTKILSGNQEESILKALEGMVVLTNGVACSNAAVLVAGGATFRITEPGVTEIAALTLGDETGVGILDFSAGATLKVTGAFNATKMRLILPDNYEVGDTVSLMTCEGAVSEATKTLWTEALATGLGSGKTCELETVTEAGVTTFKMTVMSDEPLLIRLEEGTSNATENVTFGVSRVLEAQVVTDPAVLTLSGEYGKGMFLKTGLGKASLVNTGNDFLAGLTLDNGMLSVADVAALGMSRSEVGVTLKGGTLEFTQDATLSAPIAVAPDVKAAAVVIKNDAVLSTAVPAAEDSTGAIIKRGVGTWTIPVTEDVSTDLSSGCLTIAQDAVPTYKKLAFAAGGMAPTNAASWYGTFNVVEGEVKITSANTEVPTLTMPGLWTVGLPTTAAIDAQPGLVIDHVNVNAHRGSCHFHLCGGNPSYATNAYVKILNGGSLYVDTFAGFKNSSGSSFAPTLYVSNGTLRCSWAFQGNFSYSTTVRPSYIFGPGSTAQFNAEQEGPVTMFFTNATYRGNSSLYGSIWCINSTPGFARTWYLTEGTKFYCGKICRNDTGHSEACGGFTTEAQTFFFDDAEWIPSAGDYNFTFTNVNVRAQVAGKGITLAPTAGKTWRWATPLDGAGDLVKKGAGLLVLDKAELFGEVQDAPSVACMGTVKVTEGTLQVNAGAVSAGVRFAGPGTITGTLESPIFETADDASPVLQDVTIAGTKTKIDLGGTAAHPVTLPMKNVTLMTYSGNAPDVSNWRVTGIGLEGYRGVVTAADGEIKVTLKTCGTCVIIR